ALTADANIPARMTLFSVAEGAGAVSGHLVADSADLALLKTLIPGSDKADVTGRLTARLNASGTWAAPVFDGQVKVANGTLSVPQMGNVRLYDITADLE